jgi:hypothetical protein
MQTFRATPAMPARPATGRPAMLRANNRVNNNRTRAGWADA